MGDQTLSMFSIKLRKAIADSGKTQSDLHKETQIATSTISSYVNILEGEENSRKYPSVVMAQKLAKALKVSIDWLMDDTKIKGDGTMTLLKALTLLQGHKDKKKVISFILSFHGVTRTAEVGKRWSKARGEWTYLVKETNCPTLVYTEAQIVSAIAGISGAALFGNTLPFSIENDEPIYTDL